MRLTGTITTALEFLRGVRLTQLILSCRAAFHTALFAVPFVLAAAGLAQAPAAGASAAAAPAPHRAGAYDWFGRAGLVCGAGASDSSVDTKPTVQCGGVFSGPLFDLEAGVMGPQATRSAVSGYLSTNLWFPVMPLKTVEHARGLPLVVGGYTRMFETGHALDYGLAYAHPIDDTHSIQFEVRDYWAFANPSQHNVVFRLVWLVGLPD